MFKLFHKQSASPRSPTSKSKDLNLRLTVHYGIPATASVLAFDLIQRLIAVGTLDGRIKVIGGPNVEALLVSPTQLPFKKLEFLQNQGFLVSLSNQNEIQVWDLEQRQIVSNLQWESNITAFKVIHDTCYTYLGDEHGMVYVIKYDAEQRKLLVLPYYVPTNVIAEVAGVSSANYPSVFEVLPQPCSQGNRVLIAYKNGLLVIWDVSEDQVVLVRGKKDFPLKAGSTSCSPKEIRVEVSDCTSGGNEVDKEISSLCWASNDGSILAVGYVDGDIMFWNLATATPEKNQREQSLNNVAKLRLSCGEKSLPVIVLQWSADRFQSDRYCKLFVYGGDKMGSKETFTILSLEWSSGIESMKCVSRMDLTLSGSFVDMLLLPNVRERESGANLLFVLANPGQLHFYDNACLAAIMSRQEKKACLSSGKYDMPIPTDAPCMTVSKLGLINKDGEFYKAFSKIVSAAKIKASQTSTLTSRKWPLIGGVPSCLSEGADYQVERLYMAGYKDGSVRIWDATYPAFSLIFILGTEVSGIDNAGASTAVSALEICYFTLSVAIGNESGMISLYKLTDTSAERSLNIVKETEKEVHTLHQAEGPQCLALFSFLSSPVCLLQFAKSGSRLAVGFKCGRVAMLDVNAFSVVFITDSLSQSNYPVISLATIPFTNIDTLVKIPKNSITTGLNDNEKLVEFVLTKDAYLVVLDGTTGNLISSQSLPLKMESSAISLYILESGNIVSATSSEISKAKNKLAHCSTEQDHGNALVGANQGIYAQVAYSEHKSKSLQILLCLENVLQICSLKSVIQGSIDSVRAANLLKPCCWTSAFKIDEKQCGLALLYPTGVLEIRSMTTLEVLGESSLTSLLRWNFKNNMEKIISSSNRGQIILINGYEIAAISILALENDFRIPDSLPCIHDTVVAAAVDATVNKTQDTGILGGIIKGLGLGYMVDRNVHVPEACRKNFSHLGSIFSSPPFLKPSKTSADEQKVLDLNIDDLHIDKPVTVSYSNENIKNDGLDTRTEKERLFEGTHIDSKPKQRTPLEIRAKYRGNEDAAAAAARARERLIERQEKLEMINERTQELQDNAQNFASMAAELAKREKKRWWN